MNNAEQAYQTWLNQDKTLIEIAENLGGHIALSDDLYTLVEMPDGSCVVDSACSESTHSSVEAYLKILEEFDNSW